MFTSVCDETTTMRNRMRSLRSFGLGPGGPIPEAVPSKQVPINTETAMKRILNLIAVAIALLPFGACAATVNANFTSPTVTPITAASYTASGNDVNITLGFVPQRGTCLTIINNTGAAFISGQFSNLAHGQKVSLTYDGGTYPFIANYYGGTGNDLVLQWAYQSPVVWGYNSNGQLGNNSTTDSSVAMAVDTTGVLAGKTVIAIAGGGYHSLALCVDGTVAAWGYNIIGQLGNNSTTDSNLPVAVDATGMLAGKTVVGIAAGMGHSLVLAAFSPAAVDPYLTWLRGTLSETDMANPAITGELAMPAGDRITNLMKYALCLTPLTDGNAGLPVCDKADGYLTLTYRKNKQATDVTYTVQAGSTLTESGWTPAATILSQTDERNYWKITIRDNVPIAGNPCRFMRLRVSR